MDFIDPKFSKKLSVFKKFVLAKYNNIKILNSERIALSNDFLGNGFFSYKCVTHIDDSELLTDINYFNEIEKEISLLKIKYGDRYVMCVINKYGKGLTKYVPIDLKEDLLKSTTGDSRFGLTRSDNKLNITQIGVEIEIKNFDKFPSSSIVYVNPEQYNNIECQTFDEYYNNRLLKKCLKYNNVIKKYMREFDKYFPQEISELIFIFI